MPERWVRDTQYRINAVGVIYENADGTSRQEILNQFEKSGSGELELVREPQNPYGATAIAVFTPFGQVGYVPGEYSTKWAPLIDAGDARYTVGYTKIGQYEPEPGKRITTLQFDVDEWTWADRRGTGSGIQPPEQRRLTEVQRSINRPRSRSLGRLIVWIIAIPILVGLVRVASNFRTRLPAPQENIDSGHRPERQEAPPRWQTEGLATKPAPPTSDETFGDEVFGDTSSDGEPPEESVATQSNATRKNIRHVPEVKEFDAAGKRSKSAASKLAAAKGLKTANPAAYKRRLREIVDQFPETDAATEAGKLLGR